MELAFQTSHVASTRLDRDWQNCGFPFTPHLKKTHHLNDRADDVALVARFLCTSFPFLSTLLLAPLGDLIFLIQRFVEKYFASLTMKSIPGLPNDAIAPLKGFAENCESSLINVSSPKLF